MQRNNKVDGLRLFSLFGICLVNLPFLALSPERAFSPAVTGWDGAAVFLGELLFQSKFFLLFSFLFGWGIDIQSRSARRTKASFAGRYGRRLAMLALLGVGHALLVFTGDILLLYALLGLCIWPLRHSTPRTLIRVALLSALVAALALIIVGLLLGDAAPAPLGGNLGGSFVQAIAARFAEWPGSFLFLLLFQGPLAFGAFAAGLAAAKTGLLEAGSAAQRAFVRWQPLLLAIAIPANLYFAVAMSHKIGGLAQLGGLAAMAIGAPALAAVYLRLVMKMAEGLRLPLLLSLAGANSLTVYVLQGVIAGLLFGGYGLGLFNRIGHAGLLLVAPAIALTAMIMVGLYARRFGRGPLEQLLRRVTYGASVQPSSASPG